MFRKFKAFAVAAMAVLAFMPVAVEATPYASSILGVTDGTFSGAGFVGFSSFDFRLNQISATLNGTTVNSPGTVTSDTGGSSLDQPVTCISNPLGGCASFVNNVYFPSLGVNAVGGSYAVADSNMTNTAISAGTGIWGSETQAQLNAPGNATAQTGTDNALQWDFESPGGLVAIDFDLTRNFEIFKDVVGEFARATSNILVQIFDADGNLVATLFSSTRQATLSKNAPGNDIHPLDDVTTAAHGEFFLDPGLYSLLITFGTSVDVRQAAVPEPTTLGLLGLGLVGSAYFSRRRRS
jgi:hypothetical protein